MDENKAATRSIKKCSLPEKPMWYAANKPRKQESQEEKKLREARETLKWTPCLAIVALIALGVAVNGAVRHPDVAHLLRIVVPVGLTLACFARWQMARATLAGKSEIWPIMASILSLVFSAAGPSLREMWLYKQMILFYLFGAVVVAVALLCLFLMLWEWLGSRRTRPCA